MRNRVFVITLEMRIMRSIGQLAQPLRKKHHGWCSDQNPLSPWDDATGCGMCAGLHAEAPELPGDPRGLKLMAKHFPNNIPVKE